MIVEFNYLEALPATRTTLTNTFAAVNSFLKQQPGGTWQGSISDLRRLLNLPLSERALQFRLERRSHWYYLDVQFTGQIVRLQLQEAHFPIGCGRQRRRR